MKKVLALLLCGVMMVGCLAGCGKKDDTTDAGNQGANEQKEELVKIGVLISDATSAEALAFRNYYENYIGKNFNVQITYSDIAEDATDEKSAIDNFIALGCKGVISFSSFDRPAQLEQCAAAKIYYAVATGTLTEEQYEAAKANEYYVGAIGPSLDTEFQIGYDMAKYYLDQGKTKFAIFSGALPYFVEMHIYRVAGMLTAMVEAGGEGANYMGATDKGSIIGAIYGANCALSTAKIGNVELVGYHGGFEMDDAWWGKAAEMCAAPGLEVIMAVDSGASFFGNNIKGTDIQIATVGSYTEADLEAAKSGSLHYIAGKFAASIGPIFMATYRACLGNPIRTAEGNALALDQGYWVAKSADEFAEYYAVDSSVETPAYTADVLNTLKTCDYAAFEEFVGQYSFEEIKALQK